MESIWVTWDDFFFLPLNIILNWAVLSDEQMSNEWPFSLLNDEQMSNKVGVEHQPVKFNCSVWPFGGNMFDPTFSSKQQTQEFFLELI